MNQQIPRLLGVFVLAGAGLAAARHYLIPETYGDLGHYRAAAIETVKGHERKFAGQAECALCHDDVATERLAGNHRGVSCEVCHGPAAAHTQSPSDVKPKIPETRQFCTVCHQYDPSRPTGFPQIDPVGHNPLIACTGCHNPHAPVPPSVPEECRACHGQIARAKAVSKHARVTCTTCHQVPERHKEVPHAVRPTLPTDRATCTRCHAQPDESKRPGSPPQIDVDAHNPPYQCWQCHYPHHPRAV